MRRITGINFAITSHCNLACPECCCDIPNLKDHAHVAWDYVVEAARCLKGIERVNLTGGEPLLHPELKGWAPKLKALFGCKTLIMETNALLCRQHAETFPYFDLIAVSHYTREKGFKVDNSEHALWIKTRWPKTTVVGLIEHLPRSVVLGKPCARATAPQVAYWNGLLYPCCLGPGVPHAKGIPLTPDWHERIQSVLPECATCFLSVE